MFEKYSEIALLYELSLTTLKFEEPKDKAKSFLQTIISRKSLNYGAIWLFQKKEGSSLHYELLYGLPPMSQSASISEEKFEELFQNSGLALTQSCVFSNMNLVGNRAYFKLEDIGLLELCAKNDPNKLSYQNAAPLTEVVNQLATSIKGSLSFQKLQEEVKRRKEAELLIKKQEEKFAYIINNVQLGLLEVDNDEIITYANQAFRKLSGYSLNELIGQKASSLFIKDDANRKMVEEQTKKREEGLTGAYEVPIISKNGEKKYVVISGAPNYDEKGNIIGSIGIHLDITEQKKLNVENEFKDQRIKKLFDISLDALISMNEDGYIFEWSKQAEKIFNYSAEEAINKKLSDLIIPLKYRVAHEKGMEHFHKTQEGPVLNKRFEISAIRKNGEEFPIELTIFPIYYEGKHYFTSFIRDITELKNSKLSMQKALEEQKKLNEMKSKFISMTSHELRTPLTTIKANTEILSYQLENSQKLESNKVHRNIERMAHNINRLNLLIDNILLIGKIGSEMVSFNPEPTYPDVFIQKSILPNLVKKPEIKITGDSYKVPIDHGLFTQIINNLTENAFKYSPEAIRKPIILIEFNSQQVDIHVQDFGIVYRKKNKKIYLILFFVLQM